MLSKHRSRKLLLATAFVGFAVLLFVAHATVWFYPWYPVVGYLTAVALLAVYFASSGAAERAAVAAIGAFIMAYHLLPHFYTTTEMGGDTAGFLRAITAIIETGEIEAIRSGFYQYAPLYHLLSSTYGLVTSVSGPDLFLVHVFPVLMPFLASYAIVRRLCDSGAYATTAAVGSGLTSYLVAFSLAPIPNLDALFVWATVVLLAVIAVESRSRRELLLLGLMGVSSLFVHKLSVFLLLLTVLGVLALSLVRGLVDGSSVPTVDLLFFGRATAVLLSLLVIQWMFLTDFFYWRVFGLSQIFASTGGSPAQTYQAAAATPVSPESTLTFLLRYANIPTVLAVGGFGWLLAFRYTRSDQYSLLLSASGVLGVLSTIGYFTAQLSQERTLLMGEFLLVTVFFLGIAAYCRRRSPTRFVRYAPIVIVVFLLVPAQMFVPTAVADHPDRERRYLTEAEWAGIKFIDTSVNQPVYSDEILTAKYGRGHNVQFEASTPRLLQQNISTTAYPYYYHRTKIDIYQGGTVPGSRLWRLEYRPERDLDGKYNRVYSSGDGIVYVAPGRGS